MIRETLLDVLAGPMLIEPRMLPRLMDEARQQLMRTVHGGAAHVSTEEPKKPQLSALYDCESMAAIDLEDSVPRAPASLIAVVPLAGVVTRHGYAGYYSSVPGTLEIGREIQRLYYDESIAGIVMPINSGGGSYWGTPEFSKLIYDLREEGLKKIVACADPFAASAAVYIGSSCNEFYSIASGDVGSIGVVASYCDMSKLLENAGIKIDYIRTPEMKARFSGTEPLTPDMRESLERSVAESYQQFLNDMARNRKCTVAKVESDFGRGEVMSAAEAVRAGLIDGISSVDQVIASMAVGAQKSKRDYMRKRAEEKLKAAKEASVPSTEGEATASV